MKPIGYRGELSLTSASKVREWPQQENAFSLCATKDVCKYATDTCWQGCYAKKGRLAFPNSKRAHMRNHEALKYAATKQKMADMLVELLSWMKFGIFRIHVSGDFFSQEYAKAWINACRYFKDAQFWAYTRSQNTNVLRKLCDVENLRINLSADRDNWRQMLSISKLYPCFGLSYYSVGENPPEELYSRGNNVPVDNPKGLIVFVDKKFSKQLNLLGTCPTERADNRWKPEGACASCRRCLN